MSGQTCAGRSFFPPSRSGLTWSWKHTRTPGSLVGGRSEVELVDVVGVELERLPEQDRVVGADGEVAEVAGGELVALVALDVTVDERLRGVRRQRAEVARIPERELLDGPVLDV